MLAERLGSLTILHVEIAPDVTLVVQAEGGDRTPLQSPIALDISPSACHLFSHRWASAGASATGLTACTCSLTRTTEDAASSLLRFPSSVDFCCIAAQQKPLHTILNLDAC
ncbi:hypothetical protein [Mesorhizobium sp.]|uniref:hypothetical protein n=1 Tax=Mesorhizobium sp. TaxID=1871066 RepID=UPI0025E276B5|nr:hypothetical protein [Mesorhizobium sp.]